MAHAYHLNTLLEQLLKDVGLSVAWKDTILPLVLRISEQVKQFIHLYRSCCFASYCKKGNFTTHCLSPPEVKWVLVKPWAGNLRWTGIPFGGGGGGVVLPLDISCYGRVVPNSWQLAELTGYLGRLCRLLL